MLEIFTLFIAISMGALLLGFIFDKEIFTQILFLNSVTNFGILIIVALGTRPYSESYLDIALIYAFLSFITTQAILKYFICKKT